MRSEETYMKKELRSDMTAVVLSVEREVGDRVVEGDEIVVLESMKMEIPVIAPASGILTEVVVAEGETVTAHDLIAVITTGT